MKNHSRRPSGRRLSALLAAGALATSAVGTVTMLPAQAAPLADPGVGYDAAPAQAAADWIAGELTGGLIHNPNYGGFDDYGLSIDTALSLDAVGGHQTTVDRIADAIATNVGNYTSGGPASTYSGAVAKAAVLAQVTGRDATAFGGSDLIARLAQRASDEAPITGRIVDSFDAADPYGGDYANVIGQAYAARALTNAGSSEAAAATSFLLDQQCDAGFFRLYFTPKGPEDPETGEQPHRADQTCGGGTPAESAADTDVTAIAVLALDAMPESAGVSDELQRAVAWLEQTQATDGSFGGGPATEAPNTNSTGLAGWALGVGGKPEAAQRAAGWVRRHQAEALPPCVSSLAQDSGALGYDLAAFTSGLAGGLGQQRDQWQRATAQALPALVWARPEAATTPSVSGPVGYVRGGSAVPLNVGALSPNRALCASGGATPVASFSAEDGTARVAVTPTERTGAQRWTVTTATGSAQVSLSVLGDKTLRPQLKRSRLIRGARQVVRVSGLAARESVTVRLGGVKVAAGRASASGDYVARFVVRGKRGPAKVRVQGQFADRAGTVRFTVA